MKTVKVKIHPDTYKIIKKTADEEGDTIEDFLEDFIEGSFGNVGPDEEYEGETVVPEVLEEPEPRRNLVRGSNQSRTLARIPEEYRKQLDDMLNEQKTEGRKERMMNALKYVVQQLMCTPGTGDRRDWAQQMLKDICTLNGDPYTQQTEAALDDLLKASGYMDLFSFGRSNPMPPSVPDPFNTGERG